MKQTVTNTKKSLGRVWSRYFQLYGVTSKLATACMEIGWTQAHVEAYAKGHYHLVNQQTANMVKDIVMTDNIMSDSHLGENIN